MGVERELEISAWGQRLAARLREGEGVPLLALHGWLDNANSFAPLSQHLRQPLLAMDFAGHGLSGHRPPHAATHYVDHVRDVLAMADSQGWERFDLIGHSMGAGVATLFAATFPERVRRLVLIEGLGPPATAGREAPEQLRKAIDDMQALAGKTMPLYTAPEQAIEARTRGFGGLSHDCARLLCERGLYRDQHGWRWRTDPRLRLASSLRLSEEQVEGFIRGIRAPVLLLVGEQGMGGSGAFDHRLEWLGQYRLQRLPGRHHLHMETPERVAVPLREFLETDKI